MIVSHENARQLCRTVFAETMRAPAPAADVAVDVLVAANLRGIDSHGISVLPYYLDKWRCGQIVPDAEPAVVSETPTTVVFDGQQAIGHYASLQAMDAAISRAREHGLGAAVVRQSTHNGAISHYTIHAARNGMIGIAATACAPHVAPFGGTSGLHGTNPISYAFPRGESDPLVFDLSTGHSSGKLKEAAQRDGRLPENTALCRRCQCDLTLLRQAAGTCRFYHRQCLLELKAGRINAALHHARRGYTFFPNPNSERLLAICCMIAGQWSEALTLAHWADKEP